MHEQEAQSSGAPFWINLLKPKAYFMYHQL